MNTRRLNEQDINRIVNRVISEDWGDPFAGIKGAFKGLKGVWRGEGYDYYYSLSQLLGLVRRMQSKANSTDYLYNQMEELSKRVQNSKMSDDKKDNILKAVNAITQNIDELKDILGKLDNRVSSKIR